MKPLFPTLAAVAALLAVGYTLRPVRNAGAFDLAGFGETPALVNGRIKPLDTVARTTLLTLQGRQRVQAPDGRPLTPDEWFLDVMLRPALADTYRTFEIVHPDVLSLLSLATAEGDGGKRFSLAQIRPKLAEVDRQARLADDVESAVRTPFQKGIVQLRNAIVLYQHLQLTLIGDDPHVFLGQLDQLAGGLAQPAAAASPAQQGLVRELGTAFATMERFSFLHPIPPPPGGEPTAWASIGTAWTRALESRRPDPAATDFAALARAWVAQDATAFNRAVASHRARLEADFPGVMTKARVETRFNSAEPFYTSAVLYVIAFLCAVVSWLRWPAVLGPLAFRLVAIAFALSTAGIVTRMWLEARPPVTNLYSSALFVGWGAVALCLALEAVYRNAIGSVTAGLTGFATLLIAHHLALGGDTLEMMRAVLDSNFWLATHVVTIAVGYSATFLAGFLGLVYVLRGLFTRSLDAATAESIHRMMYGVICFATLFSFVGTVLGGIWADQSWGRFWGWDPKENGALIIVIWNAIILHARWAGLVRARGIAALAIFGNVVTAWSWFGVNMLGVGLHSYGFMDSAFWWLIGFVASQLLVILAAAVPTENWRSFRTAAPVSGRGQRGTLAAAAR